MAWSDYKVIISEGGVIVTKQEVKVKKLTSAQIIDCDNWRVLRPASEEDRQKSQKKYC